MRQLFGSDCRAVEVWLSALVATEKSTGIVGASPRLTGSPLVEIGTLKVERNIRTRRKMVVEEEVTETVTQVCWRCKEKAIGSLTWKPTGTVYAVCVTHQRELPKRCREWVPPELKVPE